MTLGGNMFMAEWKQKQYQWKIQGQSFWEGLSNLTEGIKDSFMSYFADNEAIQLKPFEIKVFKVIK